MQTHLSLPYGHDTDLPEGHIDEIRTPPVLIERFLAEYTDTGDRVFDPFGGYGTTLAVAEDLDRVACGLEYEPERVELIRDRLENPEHVRQGDVLDFDPESFPSCEFAFTSPPFMTQDMETNPFENYEGQSSYDAYLDDAERAFELVADVLEPGGRLVVDVVNLKHEGRVTPLAWDLADQISNVISFEGEIVVSWVGDGPEDTPGSYGYGYDHSYCLVFDSEA